LEEEWAAGLNEAVSRLIGHEDMLCALVAPAGDRCQVVVARGGGSDLDCGALLREGLRELGGKGGGRPERAQGGYEGPAAAGVESLGRRLGLW
jgi:alanyl-tRNA synthetase